jgi:hypothetical protein
MRRWADAVFQNDDKPSTRFFGLRNRWSEQMAGIKISGFMNHPVKAPR